MKASWKFFNVVLLVHNGGKRLQFVFLILGGELVSDIYYSHTHTGGGADLTVPARIIWLLGHTIRKSM